MNQSIKTTRKQLTNVQSALAVLEQAGCTVQGIVIGGPQPVIFVRADECAHQVGEAFGCGLAKREGGALTRATQVDGVSVRWTVYTPSPSRLNGSPQVRGVPA